MHKATVIEFPFSEGYSNTPTGIKAKGFGGPTVWSKAQQFISQLSHNAPKLLGYHETDFLVTWEDGATYGGRLDIKHPSCPNNDTNLAEHIREHCACYSGSHRPAHLTDEQYQGILKEIPAERQTFYLDILNNHKLED